MICKGGINSMIKTIFGWADEKTTVLSSKLRELEEDYRRNKRASDELLRELTSDRNEERS